MLETIIALRIIGTILLAIKLIGFKRRNIIKKCVGKSLIIDINKNVYILKQHYLEMLAENIYATIGIMYIIMAEIINLFLTDNVRKNGQLKVIILTIVEGTILWVLANLLVKFLLKIIDKKENEMITVDDSLIDDGAVAMQILKDDSE